MSSQVVTRFAPSPTGFFHVGGVRSALYNYLFARKHGGKFILRSEDTDPVRSKKEYEDYFLEVFKWLGLEHDEFYRQSERTDIYRKYIEKMIAEDKAYISKEEPAEEGKRAEVIRLRNPGKEVTFNDIVLGDITVNTADLGDFVIARSIDSPLYHLTVVVDDFEMGITHVIRGQEHVANTPRQILIQEAIGAPRPIYAHGSIILNNERAKLSKRDPLVRPTLEYRNEGYLPEAMLNFMAFLGWNPGGEKELYSIDELIAAFSLERMQKPGAIFNPEKLEWYNKEYIKMMEPMSQADMAFGFLPETLTGNDTFKQRWPKVAPIAIERIGHFGEIAEYAEQGEFDYYTCCGPEMTPEKLFWKEENDRAKIIDRLSKVKGLLETLPEDNTPEEVKAVIWPFAESEGRGQVLWPTRMSLCGREKSPDPFTLISILGKSESIRRINHAIVVLEQ